MRVWLRVLLTVAAVLTFAVVLGAVLGWAEWRRDHAGCIGRI